MVLLSIHLKLSMLSRYQTLFVSRFCFDVLSYDMSMLSIMEHCVIGYFY